MRAGNWSFVSAATLLLAASPSIASAQGGGGGGNDLLTPLGEYVLLGGGAGNFAKGATRDHFDAAGTWDARLGIGSRFYVGAELGYVGSKRAGKNSGPDLTANGAEGVIRLQVPYESASWLVEPFVFGGIGWSHVSLGSAAATGLKSDDEIGVVPFGGGVTVGYGHVLLDARFTYRAAFSEDLKLAPSDPAAKLSQWGVGASVGYEF